MKHILTAALILAASPALAREIPRADFDQYCRNTAVRVEKYGSHADQYSSCMSRVQSEYDELKRTWDRFSDQEQNTCVDAIIGWDSYLYSRIDSCLTLVAVKKRRAQEDADREAARRAIPKQELRY